MESERRQREILSRARSEGRVDVAGLASQFQVAPETVRRDLRQLTDQGVLQRVHGGAYPVESVNFETGLEYRTSSLTAEKRRIGAAGASRLRGAETVYIDEGSTPQFVAEAIPLVVGRPHHMTIVTSSLLTAAALATTAGITVIVLGGRLRGLTMGVVDHWAIRMLDDMVLDLAYVGANGISRVNGLTSPDPAVAAVKSRVVSRARRKIFVGTHNKFGVSTFCRFADVTDFEALVTDTGLSPGEAQRYGALGANVVRV